ncbi:multidrug effflux MFS transporter [Dasania marina]|uniref:multidrug effflux MFS transporter n=1 Tax=Dasania marina TaxID=471499 RepID=UPI00036752FA|nr:multidrug effflux MFS transporter [Dasania marina]
MSQLTYQIGKKEFICVMALLMSMVALSIDTILPALTEIGGDLGVGDANNIQLIISAIYLGMAVGIILFGPLSDSYGRKRVIYLGIAIFLIGNLVSVLAGDFKVMLIGRLLQGFGAASCRVLSLAIIRDRFEGKEMGQVLSLIMSFFILVPIIAPSIGQVILRFLDWRFIFIFTSCVSLVAFTWLYVRQVETLPLDKRLPFTFSVIRSGMVETLSNKYSFFYMLSSGFIFGAFICYISLSPQLLKIQYDLGKLFSVYFSALALVIGLASFLNYRLVTIFSMRAICLVSVIIFGLSSSIFLIYVEALTEQPELAVLLAYLSIMLFCFGVFYGNVNALAVQPLGHIAGLASSVVTSVQTFMAIIIAGVIGQCYDGTVRPIVIGFLICGMLGFTCLLWAGRSRSR